MRRSVARLAPTLALLACLTGCAAVVETPFGAIGGVDEDDPARLDFLAPLVDHAWHRTIGAGDGELELRATGEVVLPGVLVRLRTEAFEDGAYRTVVEGTVGYDPRRGRFVHRAWTVDGSFMEGTVFPGVDGEIVFDFDLTTAQGTLPLRQRYRFPSPDRCTWVTTVSREEGEVFDVGEMRRAVPTEPASAP